MHDTRLNLLKRGAHRPIHQRTRIRNHRPIKPGGTRRTNACLPYPRRAVPHGDRTTGRHIKRPLEREDTNAQRTEAHQPRPMHSNHRPRRDPQGTHRTSAVDTIRREAPPTPAERPPHAGPPKKHRTSRCHGRGAHAGAPQGAAQGESCPQGNRPILTISAHHSSRSPPRRGHGACFSGDCASEIGCADTPAAARRRCTGRAREHPTTSCARTRRAVCC